jgi:hypothetical protein
MRSTTFLLASLLVAALLTAAVPAQAGTLDNPEVTDAEHDIGVASMVPGCISQSPVPPLCIGDVSDTSMTDAGLGSDLVKGWISDENATSFKLNIQTHASPTMGLLNVAPLGPALESIVLTSHMTIGGTEYTATATYTSAGLAVSGSAASAETNATDDTITTLTFLKSAVGAPKAGDVLSGFFLESAGRVTGSAPLFAPADAITDRAPDSDSGNVYNFTGGAAALPGNPNGAPGCTYRAGETNKADADGDCLPDYWEKQYFNNTITEQNGSGDPDHDGATNYQEYIAGTDPTKSSSKPGGNGGFPNGNPACTYKTGETNKTDTDGDCLPDYWETKYFGDPTSAQPTADPDQDGCNNLCEYLNGTDPKDAKSAPPSNCTFRSDETNKTDSDGDCLPDHWERQYFPDLSQNGAGDPDGDFCNNRCEYLHGTDPTKPDTDHDGSPDGTEVQAGTDPTNPNSHPTTSATTTPPAVDDSPLGKLSAHVDYLAESTGAALSVLVVCVLALVRRWAL